jgi:hypothetical protein
VNRLGKQVVHTLEMAAQDLFLYQPFKLRFPSFNRHDFWQRSIHSPPPTATPVNPTSSRIAGAISLLA